VEVWWTSNVRPPRLGEEKKKERKKQQGKNIMAYPIPQGGHKKERKNHNRFTALFPGLPG